MSQMVQSLALAALKLHPRNEEFFSNAEGEDFKRLKESIQEQGILTPLRVSSDMVIVSGHQRYRAAKELGMVTVPVIVDETLLDEDEKLAQLIASNFGRMKNDPVKQGRWIKEYERLRGVKVGRPDKFGNNSRVSQEDIAKELGVDLTTLRNLKRLDTLLPELQEIISEGRINATTGFKLIARLSEEEQQKLLEVLPAAKSFTQKQVQAYVDQINGYETQIDKLTKEKDEMTKEAAEATKAVKSSTDSETYLAMKHDMEKAQEEKRQIYEEYNALKNRVRDANRKTTEEMSQLRKKLAMAEERANRVPNVVEREVEREVTVYPDDYETLKAKAVKYDKFVEMNIQSKDIESLNSPEEQQKQYELWFMQEIEGFVPEFRGLLLDAGRIRNMSEADQSNYRESLEEIIDIASKMLEIMNEKKEVA